MITSDMLLTVFVCYITGLVSTFLTCARKYARWQDEGFPGSVPRLWFSWPLASDRYGYRAPKFTIISLLWPVALMMSIVGLPIVGILYCIVFIIDRIPSFRSPKQVAVDYFSQQMNHKK